MKHENDPAHDPKHDPSAFLNEELWNDRNNLHYTLFAARKIKGRPWYRSDMDATEYVSEAKVLLITGQRRFTTRYTLKQCVFQLISNLVYWDGFDAENVIPHDSLANFPTDEWGLLDESLLPAADNPDIEATIAARELLAKFALNFEDGPIRRYLEVLADGYVSAADAAAELGVTEAEIWKYRKAIRKPREKWLGSPPHD